jgi:DNA repair protein RadC
MKNAGNLNAGHRSRLRAKYKKGGIDSLEFHEVMELLLFYSIHRRDTNKTAHELSKKFSGSIAGIFEASDSILKEVPGISDQTVIFLKFIKDITRLYNLDISNKPAEITNMKSHENHLIAHFTGKQQEEAVLITLNSRMERISEKPDVIYTGSVNSTKVDTKKMVQIAIESNASAVILAHNHPNGPDYPSPEDMETTRRLERTFSELSIYFADHYVVSDTKISSIKNHSVYNYITNNITKPKSN